MNASSKEALLLFIKSDKLILRTGDSKTNLPQNLIKEGQLNALYLIAATYFSHCVMLMELFEILLPVSFLSAVFKVINLHELFLYQCCKQWKPK